MINDESNLNASMKATRVYDLEERTARFGERAIRFARGIRQGPVNSPLITQLVKAASSIGANYCEANDAESKADFSHKIGICRKESKEAKHFLRMLVAADPSLREAARELWKEAKELNLIFSKIQRTARTKRTPPKPLEH
jgi:four helix bundle protein